MRILVTGAAGFVGRQLVQTLKDKEHNICAIYRTKPVGNDPTISYKIIDFSQKTDWHSLFSENNYDAVIHLADGLRAFEGLKQSPGRTIEQQTIETTMVLAQAAAHASVKTFVYLSSIKAASGAYSDHILVETDPPSEQRPLYGQLKGQIERKLQNIAQDSAMPKSTIMNVISLRSPIVYGAGGKNNFWKMIKLADSPVPLPFAGLTNKRSIISVINLCDALSLAAQNKPSLSGQYFVHDGPALSLPELMNLLRHHLGKSRRLFPVPKFFFQSGAKIPILKPALLRLSRSLEVSHDKFRRDFNWQPPINSHDAVQQTVKSYLSQKNEENGQNA